MGDFSAATERVVRAVSDVGGVSAFLVLSAESMNPVLIFWGVILSVQSMPVTFFTAIEVLIKVCIDQLLHYIRLIAMTAHDLGCGNEWSILANGSHRHTEKEGGQIRAAGIERCYYFDVD